MKSGCLVLYFKRNKYLNSVFFFVAFVFSTLFLLASDGRMGAGFFLLTLVFIFIQKRVIKDGKNIRIGRLILICIVGMVIVSLMLKMSISSFAQYFFGIVDRLLLNSDQRGYIQYMSYSAPCKSASNCGLEVMPTW